MAMPYFYADFPINRSPKNEREVQLLMQSNDVFIIGFSLLGYMKHVFMNFPSWITGLDELPKKFVVKYGQVTKTKKFCECSLDIPENPNNYVCRSRIENDNSKVISPNDCTEISFMAVDIVRENDFENRKYNFKKIMKRPYILNIDEDYFGCENIGDYLIKLGILPKHWQHINSVISELYCPRDTKQEKFFNKIFKLCLANLAKNCNLLQEKCNFAKHCRKLRAQPECSFVPSKISKKDLDDLLVYLVQRFRKEQLMAIRWAGLCFLTTPNTISFESKIKLCVSDNYGNQSAVQVHSPSLSEIKTRVNRLRNSICSLPQPSLITIARSNRDGYVPRKYQNYVECQLISMLKYCFHIKNVKVDENVWDNGQKLC